MLTFWKLSQKCVIPRIEYFHPIFQKTSPDKFGGSVGGSVNSLRELGRNDGSNIAPVTNSSLSFWLTWWVKKNDITVNWK